MESDDEELRGVVDCFPDVRFAVAYGSGAVRQHGYTDEQVRGAMTDLMLAVDDPEEWHRENVERHPEHYSGLAWLGASAVAAVQRSGAGLYYNPFARVRGRLIKYGVISRAHLAQDLQQWSSLYVSGRMHKPVRVLRDCVVTQPLLQSNLRSALVASLLLLPARFPERELYHTICGLSYLGDVRGGFAESPNKVRNIVAAQLPLLRALYAPTIAESCPFSDGGDGGGVGGVGGGGGSDDGDGDGNGDGDGDAQLHQPTHLEARQALLEELPLHAQTQMLHQLHYELRERPLTAAVAGDDLAPALCDAAERLWHREPDEPAATARLGLAMRRSLARIVLRSSAVQSLKGLLTAGGMRSVQYLGAKLAKRLR